MKRAIERAAVVCDVCGLVRRARRGRALILAYHDVVPDGAPAAGDPSLHLPRARFAEQLDLLRARYRVIPLAELAARNGERDRPRAVVTLDDAYRGGVTVGVEELVKRGLPATIFAAPGLLGGRSFWWDELSEGSVPLHPRIREHLIEEMEGRQAAVRAWAARQGRRPGSLPDYARPASEDELIAASREPGITVASHSWSHPNLARIGYEEAASELERARVALQEMVGEAWVRWVAYPYGRHSAAARRAVEASGHAGAVLVDGGLADDAATGVRDRFAVPRVNIPAGVSREGFLLRAAGLV